MRRKFYDFLLELKHFIIGGIIFIGDLFGIFIYLIIKIYYKIYYKICYFKFGINEIKLSYFFKEKYYNFNEKIIFRVLVCLTIICVSIIVIKLIVGIYYNFFN